MANINNCDYAGCTVLGNVGKNEALRRVQQHIFLHTTSPSNPFRSMTVHWHLCSEHVGAAEVWAKRVGGQADFTDLDASTVGTPPEAPDEPS